MTKRKMLKGGSLSPDEIQGFLKKSYEKKPSSFQGYQIDKSLSGERVQVYYNPSLNQAVVVHRGSAGAKDWLVNDAGLLVGYRGDRFSHAKDIQNKAEKKYGAKNVTTLGHSLGAKIAEEVGQNSKEIITLNKPTVDTKKVSGKQYDIRTSSDLVSGLSGIASSNNKTTIPSGFRNPYSEHSPDVLSRLDNKPIGKGRRGGSLRESGFIIDEEEDRRKESIRVLEVINKRAQRILDSGDLADTATFDEAINKLRHLENQARINSEKYPEVPEFNILADQIQLGIQLSVEEMWDRIENLTDRTARNIRPFKPPTLPAPKRGGSQQLREYNQANIDYLTQEEARLRGLYIQALGAGAGNNTLLEYLENLQNFIISVEVDFGNQGWVSAIFDGLTDEIMESRLALEEAIEAEQEEDDGVTDDELSSLEGGRTNARPPITPAEMFQRLTSRHNQIQQIADIRVRHDRLDRLIERYTTYIGSLPDEEPLLDDFNELLDDISDEFVALGQQIDNQMEVEGGARYRYNPATGQYTRQGIFNTGRDTDINITQAKIDDFYRQLFQRPASQSEEVIMRFFTDNNLTADEFDYIFRVIDSNTRRKELVSSLDSGNSRSPTGWVMDFVDATQNTGRQSRFRGDISGLSEAEQIPEAEPLIRTGNEGTNPFGFDDEGELIPPRGAGRMDGYSRCHDCGCDSYRDFNTLHAGGTGSSRVAPAPVEDEPLGRNPNEERRATPENLMRGKRVRKEEWFYKVVIPKFKALSKENAKIVIRANLLKKRGESIADLDEIFKKNRVVLKRIEKTFGLPPTNSDTYNDNLNELIRLANELSPPTEGLRPAGETEFL